MTNGEYESKYQKEVVKQLKLLNALLLDHTDHIIAMRAMLQIIMIYLPACAYAGEAPKEAVMRLIRACHDEDKRLRRSTRKTLRKSI
jgi:HEAT repeat protein